MKEQFNVAPSEQQQLTQILAALYRAKEANNEQAFVDQLQTVYKVSRQVIRGRLD